MRSPPLTLCEVQNTFTDVYVLVRTWTGMGHTRNATLAPARRLAGPEIRIRSCCATGASKNRLPKLYKLAVCTSTWRH